MYENIGKKIKNLSLLFCVIGGFISIGAGICLTIYLSDNYNTKDYAFIGIAVGILSAILCWLAQFFIYGFGELIDQTAQMNKKMTFSSSENNVSEKINKLKE